MTVSELKKYLELVDDETEVQIQLEEVDRMDDLVFNIVIPADSVELNSELFVIHGVDE